MDPLYWAILLVAAGVALILLEIVVPSGGLLSVFAALAFLSSIIVGFSGGAQLGLAVLVVDLFLIPALIFAAVKWWPHTPIGRMVLIKLPESDEEVLPDDSIYRDMKSLVGKLGKAKSKMLPSGAVEVGGRTYDAVSEGMPIDPGRQIRVVAVRTNKVVVRPDDSPADQEPPPGEPDEHEEDILNRPLDALGLDPLDDPLA